MIADGEASGALRPGKTILDATSGNTGIAYAMIGAARGYEVKLCLPENASPERKLILRAFGAELDPDEPARRAPTARFARRGACYAADPERYFYPDQYNNDAQLARALRHDRAGNHRADRRPRSRISSPASARAARSSAPAGGCASSTRRSS